jgi:drug/metabolite transporter (DMT)-like permease
LFVPVRLHQFYVFKFGLPLPYSNHVKRSGDIVRHWIMFGILSLIWGSSFLLIKVGLEQLDAFSLVAIRLTLGAAGFVGMLVLLRKHIPRDPRTLLGLTFVGVTNTALPFVLITWAETSIDSGLAGVLNGTTPLFTFIIAHLFLPDDRLTRGKFAGLMAGFVGVAILASRSIDPAHASPLAGQLAMLAASFCYGFSLVFIRRNLRHVDTMMVGGYTLSVGAITTVLLTLFTVRPLPDLTALRPDVALAMLAIGLVNTFIAYIIFYQLLATWGATRTSLVTYAVPPVSLLLGALVRREPMDITLLIGAALIIGGVALANLQSIRQSLRQNNQPAPLTDSPPPPATNAASEVPAAHGLTRDRA